MSKPRGGQWSSVDCLPAGVAACWGVVCSAVGCGHVCLSGWQAKHARLQAWEVGEVRMCVGQCQLACQCAGWLVLGGIVIGHRVLCFHLQLGTSIEGTCRRLLSMAQLVIQQEQGQEPLQGGQVLRAPSKARGWHLRLVSQSWFPVVNESTSQNAFWVENENPRKRFQNKRFSGGALT